MRSLLFVPADGGAKLDKAMASGRRRRHPRPRRFDRARAQGAGARGRAGIPEARRPAKQRPRLLVRINGLDTGMTDADLDAIVPGKPDAVVFPKAEGGTQRRSSRRQADCARSHRRIAGRTIKILAQTVESAAGLFRRRHVPRCKPRLIGMTWGPEDLSAELGAEANRDADGALTEPYRLARAVCL